MTRRRPDTAKIGGLSVVFRGVSSYRRRSSTLVNGSILVTAAAPALSAWALAMLAAVLGAMGFVLLKR